MWILFLVLFLLILIRQFIPHLSVIRIFSVCFTVLFAVLIFADADAIAARSNVYLYESGKTDSVDFDMIINDLSCSAIPYLLPLTEDENEDVADMAKMAVACKWASAVADDEKLSFTDFNLAVYRADRLLKSLDPASFPDT